MGKNGNGIGVGMKSLKWEGIGTKNQFPHTSTMSHDIIIETAAASNSSSVNIAQRNKNANKNPSCR